jgi:hypothetical protein
MSDPHHQAQKTRPQYQLPDSIAISYQQSGNRETARYVSATSVCEEALRSVIPFACYVRGLSTGAWGWMRDGSGKHVGPMYWETVQSAAALISPAGLLAPDDVRVQGYLDVLEDRLLLENEQHGPEAGKPHEQ